jgi:hypothetical protein
MAMDIQEKIGFSKNSFSPTGKRFILKGEVIG